MCIIIVKPKGMLPPTKRTLKTCFANNPDGAGFMFYGNNKVYIEKGFMSFKKLRRALRLYNFSINDTVIYHFRISTHGSVIGSQTHPFPVTDNVRDLNSLSIRTPLGIAHNGIFSSLDTDDKLSDTMVFIKDVLANKKVMRSIYNSDSAHSRLVEMASVSSRLAFLDFRGRIRTFGTWELDKETGLLFSNDDYKYEKYYGTGKSWKENIYGYGNGTGTGSGYKTTDEGMGECPSCHCMNTYDLFTKECWHCSYVDSTEYLNAYNRDKQIQLDSELEAEREEIEKLVKEENNVVQAEKNLGNSLKDYNAGIVPEYEKGILTEGEKRIKNLLIQSIK